VVASFSLLGDWVRHVGGDRVSVHDLVGLGMETHEFEPLPGDSAAIAEADFVLAIGLGFETWLPDLAEAAGVTSRVVYLGDQTPPERRLRLSDSPQAAFDPHLWQDPTRTADLVRSIAAALSEADPSGAAGYASRSQTYLVELNSLDAEIESIVSGLPEASRKLVTSHAALSYFADRYGFTVLGTVLPVSTETGSPSPGELAALIDLVRVSNVPAVFGARGEPEQLLQVVAQEAGVDRVILLYLDSLGAPGSDGTTYVDMMRSNAQAIAAALSP
jgi:ABC-type Zn uptake system ZnuABC Zn-binding protein ZnuA